jgi:hypothetical protein
VHSLVLQLLGIGGAADEPQQLLNHACSGIQKGSGG